VLGLSEQSQKDAVQARQRK